MPSRLTDVSKRPPFIFMKIFWLATVLMMSGCVTTRLPDQNELAAVERGQKALVLLKVIWELDGKPSAPFESTDLRERVLFKLAGIETGWKVQLMAENKHYFFSIETRQQGWTYLFLEPGTHLLSALTFNAYLSRKPQPVWRFEIPEDARSVYIGTLHLKCGGVRTEFGVNVKKPNTSCEGIVLEEKASAENLIHNFIPALGPPHNAIMQVYGIG